MNAPATPQQLAPATGAASAPALIPLVSLIPLDHICYSPTNPRRKIDEARLDEMASTIRAHGVLQPILVRLIATEDTAPRYEVIAGERRHRASLRAGKTDIPAMVRELTDEQVLVIQVIENHQREDVHPLEEALGYQRLMAAPYQFTAEQIAERIGTSRRYVFNRLKLLDLCEAARDALDGGSIDITIAHTIARVPPRLQAKALETITGYSEGAGMNSRQAARFVQSNYMLRLDSAPFVITVNDYSTIKNGKPGKLIAAACGACPKRTGANTDLFGDIKDDLCTDPDCFAAKRDAHRVRVIADAKARNVRVIEGDAAKKIRPSPWSPGLHGHERINDTISDITYDNEQKDTRKLRDLLGDHQSEIALFVDPHDGTVYEIIPENILTAALKKAGIIGNNDDDSHDDQTPGTSAPASKADAIQRKKQIAEHEQQRAAFEQKKAERTALFAEIHSAMRERIAECGGLPDIIDVQAVALCCMQIGISYDTPETLVEFYGWGKQIEAVESGDEPEEIIRRMIPTLTPPELFLFLFAASIISDIESISQPPEVDRLLLTAKRLGINASKKKR